MEVRLALSISRKSPKHRQPHSDGYADFDPRIEWREGPHSYILLVHVPGFKKENLMVEMDDTRTMTISGEEMVTVGSAWLPQGFTKQLQIPANVNMDGVAGRFERGILYIIMPKLPSNSAGGISNDGLEKPPEAEAAMGVRIEDVSLQPEEAEADDSSREIPEIPRDQSPGSGTSEDRIPYRVECPEEEIHPPEDSDQGISGSPPELEELPEADHQSLHIGDTPNAEDLGKEPSPLQIPPNQAESPDRGEELERQVEDSGICVPKQQDAPPPASDSEPADHMQQPIPEAKDEVKEEKIDELEEEEEEVSQEDDHPCPHKRICCCTKYAVLSFLGLAVVAFIAQQVRCK